MPMPMSMTRPPGVALKREDWMARWDPVHSKTVSKPSGWEKWDRAQRAEERACLSCSSVGCCCDDDDDEFIEQHGSCDEEGSSVSDEDLGGQKTSSANPFCLANSQRVGLISMATTREAPVRFARAHARRPMVPTPKTRAD